MVIPDIADNPGGGGANDSVEILRELMRQGGGDAAAGVTTESSPILIRRALSVDEFKARIQDLMENQRILD